MRAEDGSVRVWTIANQKGGVGKTTTTVALGGLLAAQGYRVLLVDLDPHGSLTSYFRCPVEGVEDQAQALFRERPLDRRDAFMDLLRPVSELPLWLLPAGMGLATVERQAVAVDGMGLRLAQALALVRGELDYVLIDTPPILGALMINALAACEQLLIPVQTEYLALKGLERMLRTLNMVNRSRGQALPHLIVPTLFDRRTQASVHSLRQLRNQYGHGLWPGMIPVDTRLRDASRAGIPPSRLDGRSRAVQAYDALLRYVQCEFEQRQAAGPGRSMP